MKKLVTVLAGATMLFAGVAAAADVTNVEFSNGDVTVQGKAGESVSGKVRVVVNVNEEVEYAQFDILGDNLAAVCVETGRLQEGTHFIDIPSDVKFPPNTGTYDLQVKTSGIFGGLAAIDCQNNVNETQTFNDSVRTVGSNANSSVGSSSMSALLAMIESLKAQIAALTAKPTKPVYCTQMSSYLVWQGQSGASVSAYQMFLISNGFSIPAGATGYYGTQTASAAAAMAAVCK